MCLQETVPLNIARGVSALAPVMALDTLVGVLLISTGRLTGISKLATMCFCGSMFLLTNLVTFLTLYPACLAVLSKVTFHSIIQLSYGNC